MSGSLKIITAFCLLSFLFSSINVIAQSPLLIKYADVVLFNGQVITVDQASTVTEAIAVRDGRILALGNTNDMLALAGPDTMKIDLHGRSVTPGYVYNDGDNSVPGGDIYKDTMVQGWLSHRRRKPGYPLEFT